MGIRFIGGQAKLLCPLLATLLVVWAASPSPANLLVNGDFEAPALGKITSGWDPVPVGGHPATAAPAGSDIPGWQNGGFSVIANPGAYNTDSGIETTGNPLPDSTYSAYSNNCDSDFACAPSAVAGTVIRASQASSYVIQAGDSFNLSVYARPLYTFDANWAPANATLHWVAYGAMGADPADLNGWLNPSQVIAQGYFDLGLAINSDGVEPYQLHSTGAISGAGFEGLNIAVQLYNSSGGVDGDPAGAVPAFAGRSWIGIDNVDLSLAVPEPTSALLLGLGSLVVGCLFRRHR